MTKARLISIVLYIVMAAAVASQTRLDLSGIALSGAVTGVIILVTVTLWQKIWRDRSSGRHATS